MDLIPLYDDTAPIACTASADEIPVRMEQVERMQATLERVERTEHGLLLHFPNRPDIDAELSRFTVGEKSCCQFWGFDIQRDPDTLRLRWDGPPSVQDFLEDLLQYFEGDRPIADFPGPL